MLAEVILHRNHRDGALVVELVLSYERGRGRAAIALNPYRNRVGVHPSQQDACRPSSCSLLDRGPCMAHTQPNLNSYINQRYGRGRPANSTGNGCDL